MNRTTEAVRAIRNRRIVKLYQQGISLREIAKKVGLSHEMVRIVLNRAGVKLRNKSKQSLDLDVDKIAQLHEMGFSVNTICRFLGASHTTIKRRLHSLNMDTRSAGDARACEKKLLNSMPGLIMATLELLDNLEPSKGYLLTGVDEDTFHSVNDILHSISFGKVIR